MKSIIILLISLLSLSLNAKVTIKGKILGENGSIQKVSGVEYFSSDAINSKRFAYTDHDGQFNLSIEENGYYEFNVIAAYHKPFNFKYINLGEDKDYELVIQLEPYKISKNDNVIEIIGDFNDFSVYENIQTMEQNGNDYKLTVPVENGKVRYQIIGIPGIPIREAQPGNSLKYEYVNGVGIATVIETDKDSIEINFNLDKLPKATNNLNIQNVSPELMRHIMANDKLKQMSNDYRNKVLGSIFEKNEERRDSINRAYFDELERLINSYNDEKNKMLFKLEYLRNADIILENFNSDFINTSIIKDIFEGNDPYSFQFNDLGYSLYPALNMIYESPMDSEFVIRLLSKDNSDELKIKFLFDAIRFCHNTNDIENAKKVMDKMIEMYPDNDLTLQAKVEYSPYKKIKVGNQLPQFEFEAAYSDKKITNDDITGKYTLIDVWASWCGPCIMQIPQLKELYKKYNEKGFEILSVSIDRSKDALKGFQSGRMEMNWLTAWSAEEYKGEVAKKFEITNIPYFILVDKSGKIVALGQDAHGENLEKILEEEL